MNWISAKNSLPPLRTRVKVLSRGQVVEAVNSGFGWHRNVDEGAHWYTPDGTARISGVTHWTLIAKES